MIKCQLCSYNVPSNLKFCLKKNLCPSCGGALLGDSDVQEINIIKNKLLRQDFSEDFDSGTLYSLALFILEEYVRDLKVEDVEDIELSDEEKLKEDIKKEVEAELANELAELESEDDDHRVARLKNIAKEHATKKTGPMVRRVS